MSDLYTKHAGFETIPCTEDEAKRLEAILLDHDTRFNEHEDPGTLGIEPHGLQLEYDGFMHACHLVTRCGHSSCAENLPDDFLDGFGKLIGDAGKPYLEVGFAHCADRLSPQSCGGGECRIYSDGSLVYPVIIWPVL